MHCLYVSARFLPFIAEEIPKADWVRYYECRKAASPIVVDGVGDEIAWQLAEQVGEFTRFQVEGDDYTVTYRTTAKMLWDNDNLYFLISVYDKDIYSTITEGDVVCLCKEETIEIFIDPDGDEYDYAEIHVNLPRHRERHMDSEQGIQAAWTAVPWTGRRHMHGHRKECSMRS